MGVITAIEPQKRKKERVNIFVDGEFAVGLPLDIVLKEELKVGEKISAPKLEQLTKENELDKILCQVYRFLSYRPRSEKEIRDYLARKKTSTLLTNLVIQALKKQNYLDDKEFCRWWVEQRIKFHPIGKYVLSKELLKKGIKEEIIEKILNSQFSILNSSLALRVAKKRAPRYQGLPKAEFRQKMGGFLARRGFNWETIKEVVDKTQKGLLE